MLRDAALNRLPHAASGLSQRLPRLLGELGRVLGRRLRRARQTTVAIPGRARTGPGRLIGLAAAFSGRRSRRPLGAVRTLARPGGPLSVRMPLVN
ncbi:hypothetical protein [Micromonospora sp. DH14]|uniref:hypothetical protein n=1 Tax=Micromonospora sp. DH14 TaxID=3040120 RepID=UPI002442966C|nr:hypothetical protein [Micromonospora sp. DH14]MDG9672412.1 hypothetical protein [Micromonospora sp. DH14]